MPREPAAVFITLEEARERVDEAVRERTEEIAQMLHDKEYGERGGWGFLSGVWRDAALLVQREFGVKP